MLTKWAAQPNFMSAFKHILLYVGILLKDKGQDVWLYISAGMDLFM